MIDLAEAKRLAKEWGEGVSSMSEAEVLSYVLLDEKATTEVVKAALMAMSEEALMALAQGEAFSSYWLCTGLYLGLYIGAKMKGDCDDFR